MNSQMKPRTFQGQERGRWKTGGRGPRYAGKGEGVAGDSARSGQPVSTKHRAACISNELLAPPTPRLEHLMSLRKYLVVPLVVAGNLAFCIQAKPVNPPSTGQETFAFWYDVWQPGVTLKKVEAANVIIGVPPSAVPEVHKSGRRALQGVTYYQSVFNQPFLKDRQDLPNVGFQANGEFEKSAFGKENNYVLCPNSVELKSRVLRSLDTSLQQGFDGYFVDNTFLDPAAHQVCSAGHQHSKENVLGGRAYLDLLAAVRTRLKAQNPAALLISNPGNPRWAEAMADGNPSLWDLADLVLWESYGYTSNRGPRHDSWKSAIEHSFSYAAMPEKSAKLLVLSYPENLIQARFSYAVARIFGFKWTANLGDSFQNTDKEGGEFGAFLREIPFDLGEPLGTLPDKSNPMLHRMFQHGEVFANTGTSPQPISLPKSSRAYVGDRTIEATAPRTLSLEPMTAAIVIRTP
jgi:hypothetical protein